jgi:NAD(P) transhydrogenase subunit alpha
MTADRHPARTRRQARRAGRAARAGHRLGIGAAQYTVECSFVVRRFFVPQWDFWSMLFVFTLATFVGFQVIRDVSRLLHTPLMSLTNAISAIAVVGSLILAGERSTGLAGTLGTIAVAASVTNIVSGFLITDRMLRMFRRQGPERR